MYGCSRTCSMNVQCCSYGGAMSYTITFGSCSRTNADRCSVPRRASSMWPDTATKPAFSIAARTSSTRSSLVLKIATVGFTRPPDASDVRYSRSADEKPGAGGVRLAQRDYRNRIANLAQDDLRGLSLLADLERCRDGDG